MADSTGTDQAPPPEVTKDSIRKKIWEHIEKENLANFPRPVTRRIPNFKGAEEAAVKAAELEEFKKAQTVKINPDKPQQHSRYLTIEAQKTLLVPTPRLRTGLFNKITPPEEQTKDTLRICSTSQGVREHSVPVGLDANIKIDLVIVGSVAVSSSGLRIGKGEGFADLEYAMMMTMEAIGPDTVVVTTVHDCQVMDIPASLMGPHDLSVDYIVTPTQVIKCERIRPQPTGIIWPLLSGEKMDRVPILKKLRLREFRAGKDVRLLGETEPSAVEDLEEEDKKVDEMAEKEANEPPPQRYNRARYFRRGRNPRYGGRRRPKTQSATDGEEADGEKGSASESDTQKKPARPRRPRRPRRRERSHNEGDTADGDKAEGETEGSGDEKGERKRPYGRRWRRRPQRKASEGSGEEKENEADSNGAGDRRSQRDRRRPRPTRTSSLYVGNIPKDLRVSVFKAKVRALNITPLQVIWHGNNAHAFLVFSAFDEVETALTTLESMEIGDTTLTVQLSKRTQARHVGNKNAAATSDGQEGQTD